ncbi:hypothetical protein DN752_10665 [Echinicola strongylocentroti]|uniref:Formyl transferase N-terminal domain-containing protein n=1 Tax=Echinicola strongylocentroti TaxID=1795355 RepID=A0A2Z4III8_9BACT|nr:formyltransferase family protein [Echinicola strongylocentroti]AWW30549.1 hypothetical protein DN752_10665 [Echinicola strongylocentroti]
MKIVIISECKAREMIVVNSILKFQPRAVVIQPKFTGVRPKKKRGFYSLANRVLGRIRYQALKSRLGEYRQDSPSILNRVPYDAKELNSPEGAEFLRRLSPDLLITCRAPLLSNEILRIPRLAAINIHYGIAPEYRGNDTLFWAMHNRDYRNIGGTIHHISPGVDTGNIIARVFPALLPGDDETSIDIKTSELLAKTLDQYLEKISNAKQLIPGVPQAKKGNNYRAAERTFGKSLRMMFQNLVGYQAFPSQEEIVETYFEEESISIFA